MDAIKSWVTEKVWKRVRRTSRLLWLLTLYGGDLLIDQIGEYISLIRREFELFLGVMLGIIGLLNFETGKYCDGNTSDYLSCTRPSAYYYFSAFDITLVVLGVFFLIFWYLRRQGRNPAQK